ncbi:MAG: translation elongation factor Ts [Cyanobacteria bacterium NC_groundwater_1444_Ag_S-0.65um_54_12]|nr:translation elongation factor Ts [Cyanobacteria bacterium NC_groundwater_1444_Ag_S-0.65um_54_12]
MKEVSAALVKELRELTGAGMMECKKALVETSGDLAKAVEELRKRGIAKGAKLASRIASEGAVGSYVHLGGKIGVLVEVNCETDFVGRSPEFQELVKVIAMHIAATAPRWIKREDVPVEVTNKEKEILAAAEDLQNKPAPVREKIVEGRLNKFFEEVCLLEQPFVKDPNSTVLDLITQKTTKLGEKIEIRRFIRYQLGEGLERRSADFAAEVAKQIEH